MGAARVETTTNPFDERVIGVEGDSLRGIDLETIQVNIGLTCNIECRHCHVVSGPRRTEQMDWETMEQVLAAARRAESRWIDITGGAPEMNPHFRRFVRALREENLGVIVRTNLTILLEPGYEDLPRFFADHRVRLVASLPCYLEENVDAQRGEGVYQGSIAVLRILNGLGYGIDPELPLDLVYNPLGPSLPPDQVALEKDYRRQLAERFGIRFNHLLTIANMPIGRFLGDLRKQKRDGDYWALLEKNFNPRTLGPLMCRHQISVDWNGMLHDCDFNLALHLPMEEGAPRHIRDFDPDALIHRRIVTARHCYGCTAGSGSSCGGALIDSPASG